MSMAPVNQYIPAAIVFDAHASAAVPDDDTVAGAAETRGAGGAVANASDSPVPLADRGVVRLDGSGFGRVLGELTDLSRSLDGLRADGVTDAELDALNQPRLTPTLRLKLRCVSAEALHRRLTRGECAWLFEPRVLNCLSASTLGELDAAVLNGLSTRSLRQLDARVLNGLSDRALGQLHGRVLNHLSDEAIGQLLPRVLNRLSASVPRELSIRVLTRLREEVLAEIDSRVLNDVLGSQPIGAGVLNGLPTDVFARLEPRVLNRLRASALRQLDGRKLDSLPFETVRALEPGVWGELVAVSVGHHGDAVKGDFLRHVVLGLAIGLEDLVAYYAEAPLRLDPWAMKAADALGPHALAAMRDLAAALRGQATEARGFTPFTGPAYRL